MSYATIKGGITNSVRSMAAYYGKYNIRVNAIAPGLTNTDMMKQNTPKEIIKDVISRTSLKRVADAKEIANAALFLSSDLSTYITGQVVRVDGGM